MTTTSIEAPAPGAPPWDAVALELARRRPAAYALVAHGLRPAPHHRRWLAALRETVETPGGRLLLIAPPGTAKCTYTSQVLPLWYLGEHPDRAVLATTSSDVMASEFHGVVDLALRANEAHRAVFPAASGPARPRPGVVAATGCTCEGVPPETKDPSYRVAGLGSSVIGSRCHLLLLDDPVTQETAQSEAEMRRARRYLDLTLLTRLHPGGSAVAIMTRWGEADVAAHLLAQGWRAEVWPQLSAELPGARAAGRRGAGAAVAGALPPLLGGAERTRLGTAQFELIHQGNPLLDGGRRLARRGVVPRPAPAHPAAHRPGAPRSSRSACAAPTSTRRGQSGRRRTTRAAVTCAYHPSDPARCLYVLGAWRRRIDQDGLAEALAEHLLAVRPHVVGVEQAAYKQAATGALVQELVYRTNGRLATTVRAIPSVVDKVTRARPAAAKGEAGLLCVDREVPEMEALIRECLALPVGAARRPGRTRCPGRRRCASTGWRRSPRGQVATGGRSAAALRVRYPHRGLWARPRGEHLLRVPQGTGDEPGVLLEHPGLRDGHEHVPRPVFRVPPTPQQPTPIRRQPAELRREPLHPLGVEALHGVEAAP